MSRTVKISKFVKAFQRLYHAKTVPEWMSVKLFVASIQHSKAQHAFLFLLFYHMMDSKSSYSVIQSSSAYAFVWKYILYVKLRKCMTKKIQDMQKVKLPVTDIQCNFDAFTCLFYCLLKIYRKKTKPLLFMLFYGYIIIYYSSYKLGTRCKFKWIIPLPVQKSLQPVNT